MLQSSRPADFPAVSFIFVTFETVATPYTWQHSPSFGIIWQERSNISSLGARTKELKEKILNKLNYVNMFLIPNFEGEIRECCKICITESVPKGGGDLHYGSIL